MSKVTFVTVENFLNGVRIFLYQKEQGIFYEGFKFSSKLNGW